MRLILGLLLSAVPAAAFAGCAPGEKTVYVNRQYYEPLRAEFSAEGGLVVTYGDHAPSARRYELSSTSSTGVPYLLAREVGGPDEMVSFQRYSDPERGIEDLLIFNSQPFWPECVPAD